MCHSVAFPLFLFCLSCFSFCMPLPFSTAFFNLSFTADASAHDDPAAYARSASPRLYTCQASTGGGLCNRLAYFLSGVGQVEEHVGKVEQMQSDPNRSRARASMRVEGCSVESSFGSFELSRDGTILSQSDSGAAGRWCPCSL